MKKSSSKASTKEDLEKLVRLDISEELLEGIDNGDLLLMTPINKTHIPVKYVDSSDKFKPSPPTLESIHLNSSNPSILAQRGCAE